MNQIHRVFENLLPGYALGALDDEEKALLEAHLARGCAHCQRELKALCSDVEAIAGAVEPVKPKADTKELLLAEIRGHTRGR